MSQSFPVPTIHRMLALATFLCANEHHELGLRIAEDVINVSTNTFNSLRRELRTFVFSREPLAGNRGVAQLLRALEMKEHCGVPKLSGGTLGSLFDGNNKWITLEDGEWLRCFLVDVLTNAIADVAQIVNNRENTLVLPHEHEGQRIVLRDALANAQIPNNWLTVEAIIERMPHNVPTDAHGFVLISMVEPAKFNGSGNDYHAAADRVDDFIRRAKVSGVESAGKQIQHNLKLVARDGMS